MGEVALHDPEKLLSIAYELLSEDPRFKVGEAEMRGAVYRVFENAPQNVAGVFAEGAKHGEKDFLIYGEERLTFAETWRRARRLARALENDLGIRPGDRVAIAMRNYPEWCVIYMAIVSLGAVVVPLNAWWKSHELEYGLKDCGAKVVFVDKKRLAHLSEIRDALSLTLVLAREEADGADYRYKDLLANAQDAAPPAAELKPDDDFCIVYTSGSTGNPKGVVLTHRGCISTLYSWLFIATVLKNARGELTLFGENAGILLAIPLFHVTGSHSVFLLSYLTGRRVAMMYRWDATEAIALIDREKLTQFVGVPSQSFELTETAGPEDMPSLLDVGTGGAKRPAEHVKQMVRKLKNAAPSSGYGLTETNAIGCVISRGEYQARPDSTGRPVPPLTDIKIMGEAGEAPRGETGEIWIRSPANFRGYLNLPDETAKALTPDGWFKTGDLGKMDDEDYVYIVDRMKDVIIRGGENISCLEVENRAYEHGDIAEAAVFSVPDGTYGERVGMVVYPKAGNAIDAGALRDFIADDLADFKVPERIWISPAPLPRLGTEKFDKITIRKLALQHPPTLAA